MPGKGDIAKPFYEEPRILLVDMDEQAAELLTEEGFNVATASLGEPYEVAKEAGYYPIENSVSLPRDYKECDIVVLDVGFEVQRERTDEGLTLAQGVKGWWVSHHRGYVNPRCLYGRKIQEDFDRILSNGGVFIIFADTIDLHKFRLGYKIGAFNDFVGEDPITFSNWNFLSITSQISISNDFGSVVQVADEMDGRGPLALLSSYCEDAVFECVVSPRNYGVRDKWLSLFENKFGGIVGSAILPDEGESREGFIFVLPRIQSMASFTAELVKEALPAIVPRLFPEFENESWIHRPEYELSAVKGLREEITKVKEEAEQKIEGLENKIQTNLRERLHLYDILTESGDALVCAVTETLNELGFSEVVDVDEVIREEGGEKKEDIQILDNSPTLVAEVKGVNNVSDEDALVVHKYVTFRMREWDRTDIQGLTIINHQKNLPPLERDNAMPFRQEMLDAAEEEMIGLITTWDLHRLARSYLRNDWDHRNVRDLFYQVGRIDPIPTHYEYVGSVQRYMDMDEIRVVGIEVESNAFQKGDRIAFELPAFFEEQVCESLELDNEPIEQADLGMLVGMKTHLSKKQAQSGVRVFRVTHETERRLDDESED